MLAYFYFVLFLALHTVNGFVRTTSQRPFPHFSLDCTTEKAPEGEENPPIVSATELKPFNEEIRAALGRTPDQLAQNMYAIGAVQGSNVFKLVGELENLSEALEKTVAGNTLSLSLSASDTLIFTYPHTCTPSHKPYPSFYHHEDMAIVAQKLKEEREAKRQEKLKKNEE